jgi:hypothetical protein
MTADKMITRGAQMLVRIQSFMHVRSKRNGMMKSFLIQMPEGSVAGRSRTVFETAGAAKPLADALFCDWNVSKAPPHDVKYLFDQGYPRSVGGINTVSALASQLGIDLRSCLLTRLTFYKVSASLAQMPG